MTKAWRFILRSATRGEYELRFEPGNWRDRSTQLVRDKNSYGINREITSPIEFIKDGFAYVKDVFNKDGYNADVFLDIFEYNSTLQRFDAYFSGNLVMKSIDIEDSKLFVNATPSTFENFLKTRNNTEIGLSNLFSFDTELLFNLPKTTITCHSQVIPKGLSATFTQSRLISLTAGQLLQIGFDKVDIREAEEWINERVTIASTEVFPVYKCKESGDHDFDVYLAIGSSSGFGDEIEFYYQINDETPVAVSSEYFFILDGFEYSYYLVTLQETIALNEGDAFRFYGVCGRSFNATVGLSGFSRRPILEADRFSFVAKTQTEPSQVEGYLAFEAVDRIFSAVTNKRAVLQSNLLGRTDNGYGVDGSASLNLITTGAALAGKPLEMKTTINKLIGGMKAIYNCGFGVTTDSFGNQKIQLENMDFFFQNQIGWRIDTVIGQVRKVVATEMIYNSLEVGYDKFGQNIPGGNDDPHTKATYHIPARFVEDKLDLVSELIASGLAIETKRREQGAEQSRNSGDEDLYIINLVRDDEGYKSRTDEGFEVVENIIEPSSQFNLDIQTARNLQRWDRYINSNYYKRPALVGFLSSESESRLRTLKTGQNRIIQENTSINSSEFRPPLWFPEEYQFECKLTTEQDKEILKNRYMIGEVITDQGTFFGYLMQRRRSEKNEASFTLLKANYNG